jgi:hypothetical protein
MPTYHVDLITDRGLQRVPFTLDDDRPLGSQIYHVLEELRQRGVVLRGGPEDELGAIWNGRDLDTARTPQALRLSPLYPIELKMRRRSSQAKEQRVEPPAQPFLPKGSYLGTIAGLSGAAIAWVVTTLFTDLGDVLSSYGALDITVAAVLGAGIGGATLCSAAARRSESAVMGLVAGAFLGAVGAGLGAFLGLLLAGTVGLGDSRQSFTVARLLAWGLMGALLGVSLGLWWWTRDRRRIVDGLIYGLIAGLVGGLVFSLPLGPSDLWQVIGFVVVGGGLGAALTIPGLHRGVGILELETLAERSVGLFRHREWEIPESGATPLGRRFEVRVTSGRCQVVPLSSAGTEPAQLAGRLLTGPVELLNLDLFTIADRRYRFRRFPEAGV